MSEPPNPAVTFCASNNFPPPPRPYPRSQRFKFKHTLYKLREERDIKPSAFAQLVSATLYEKRFGPYFCQPVIAGLEPDGTPYLCGMDSIGAIETAKDFMIAGTASDALLGICESLWRPDMVSCRWDPPGQGPRASLCCHLLVGYKMTSCVCPKCPCPQRPSF